MRHGNKVNKLSRTASHRRSLLSNMAISLIRNKRLTTTVAKAKALRVYIEPLITKSKNDTTHSRRTVFSYLGDKYAIQELFGPVAEKVAQRPGGYTRILKLGNRMGDNAEMAMIELVDFNEFTTGIGKKDKEQKSKTTRRGRSGSKKGKTASQAAEAPEKKEEKEVKAEAKTTETPAEEAKPESGNVENTGTEEEKTEE